jgi:hypothetical protein
MRAVYLPAVVVCLGAPLLVAGQLGQANTPSGSTFASTCAGAYIFSGLGDPGLGYNYQGNGASGTGYNCANQTTIGTASANSALSGTFTSGGNHYPYNSSANSSASIGAIHLQSSNQSEPAVQFPGGGGDGGWNDTITITGGPTGASALWVLPVHVDGSLINNGGAMAEFDVGVYQNLGLVGGDYVPGHPAIYDTATTLFNTINVTHNGTSGSTWDFEMSQWQVSGALASLSANLDVFFVVPFVWGTSFELGIYGSDLSAESGFGNDPTPNSSQALFQNTVRWDGPGYVADPNNVNGPPDHNFTITSGSLFNYNQPLASTPEPSSWTALALGLAMLAAARGLKRPRIMRP